MPPSAAGNPAAPGATGPGGALHPGAAARVEGLLQQQQELFARLDTLSEQQSPLIESEQTDQLLQILAERQVLVDEIARLSAQLEPWRARWADFVNLLPDQDRRRIRDSVDAVATLAERIARRDERDRQLMESRKGAIAAELGHVSRGRGAIAAYATGTARPSSAAAAPRYQDREA